MKASAKTVLFLAIGSLVFMNIVRAQEPGSGGDVATLLFVISSGGMSYDSEAGTLTMKEISPVVTFFSDRPERIAGHVKLPGFLQMWNEGADSFKKDPPNANLSVFDDGATHSAVVELLNPKPSGKNLIYKVKVLEGSVPKSGGASSLFIDGLFTGGAFASGLRGAAVGALGGAITGDTGKGAEIGAAVGVVGGALNKRKEEQAAQEKATTRVIDVPNANGSFTPVKLHLGPNGWVGPKGEIYPTLPTVDQLKEVYGVK